MNNPSPYTKLDSVLKYLIKNEIFLYEFTVEGSFEKLGIHEVKNMYELRQILDKLVKEGYVKTKAFVPNTAFDEIVVTAYSITFDGEFFINNGGYEMQSKILAKQNSQTKRNELLVILGTWLAGIGALSLTLWEIYKTFYIKHQ